LASLQGLENLIKIDGPVTRDSNLSIIGNNSLISLGLDSLAYIKNNFDIKENSELRTEVAKELRDQVLAADGIYGDTTICGNKFGDPCT